MNDSILSHHTDGAVQANGLRLHYEQWGDGPHTVVALHGAHVFPDTNALGEGESPQWLYTVAFSGRTLWGPQSTADSVRVDCWESYLLAADLQPAPPGSPARDPAATGGAS